MPSCAAMAPIAQHRGGDAQLACDLDQRPTAARQQGDRLPLEPIRKMTPFLAHSTPSRSRRSLAKVSTNSGEAQIPRLPLACLRELRLELDAWQSLLRDESRREGDKHAASAAESLPTRPLLTQGSTGADSSVRSSEAVATGERAPGGNVGRHRCGGGKR